MNLLAPLLAMCLGYWTLTTLQMREFADDPGVGWHIATGLLIRSEKRVPTTDPFLASHVTRPWLDDQWLSDLILGTTFTIGGWTLIYAILTAIFLYTFAAPVFLSTLERSQSIIWSSVASFISLKMATVHFILRPVIFGFLLFAIILKIWWKAKDNTLTGQPVSYSLIFYTFFLFILWANLHPSFVAGIVIIGLIAFGLLFNSLIFNSGHIPLHNFCIIFLAIFSAVIATLITPFGLDLHDQIINLLSDNYFMQLNNEWLPVDPRNFEGKLMFWVITIMVAGAILSKSTTAAPALPELLVIFFLTSISLRSVRYLPFLAIASAPYLSLSLSILSKSVLKKYIDIYNKFAHIFKNLDQTNDFPRTAYYSVILLIMLLPIGASITGRGIPLYDGSYGPSTERFPYKAIEVLQQQDNSESEIKQIIVASTPDWGGFITFYGHGKVRAVIDDRNSLLGSSYYRDYMANSVIGGDIEDYMKRSGATHLLLRRLDPLVLYLLAVGTMKEIYHDNVAVIFKKIY